VRFTATDKWNLYARGAVKMYVESAHIRKTTVLTDALTAGTWVDVTSYLKGLPAFSSRVEYGAGQLAISGVRLEGKDIAWWDANIFNATSSEYLEIKVVFALLQGSDVCTDVAYKFSGFVDKDLRDYDELADRITFSAASILDMGGRMAAENLTVQYVDTDIDGSGTDGLALPEIPYLFVKNAAVSSYELTVGAHTITYDYNAGTERARLDSGAWVTLSNGDNTLGNGASAGVDTERVVVYVGSTSDLPPASEEISESIVVITEGDTLPRQWYRYTSVRFLLTKLYSKLGITSVTADTLDIPPETAGSRVSYLDAPPGDDSIIGKKWALVSDGTDLWVPIGHKLYKRTMSTDLYELKATLTAGRIITRMWYNAAHGHIWIYARESAAATAGHLYRFTISGATLSSDVSLGNVNVHACGLMDVDGALGDFYGFIGVDSSNRSIVAVDSTTMTLSTLFSRTDLGYAVGDGPDGDFAFVKGGDEWWFQVIDTGTIKYHSVQFDGTVPGWVDNGIQNTSVPNSGYQIAAYHESEDLIYYWEDAAKKIRSHAPTATSGTDVLALDAGGADYVEAMQYLNARVYFTTSLYGRLYQVVSGAGTQLSASTLRVYGKNYCLAYIDRIYGLDEAGRLYQYHTRLRLYIPNAAFPGDTITGALNKILNSFNLLQTVSSTKAAFIYPRGDDAGDPKTTGNTLTITVTDPSALSMVKRYIRGTDLMEVDTGTVRWTYNGTSYNSEVLSTGRRVSISSTLIPDEIAKDLCKHVYQFFKTDRDLYRLTLGNVPLFQYEPFDGCSLTITGRKINKTASGPIYATTLGPGADMSLEVLL
jgi:hypothetical protein